MLTGLVAVARTSLRSEIVRKLVGERFFDASATGTSDPSAGILTKIFNVAFKFGKFLVSQAFSAISWSLSGLWGLLVQVYFEIKYFDWNQTDASIKARMDQNNLAIAGALGSLAGSGLVWLTGIGIAAALTAKFPVIAGQVALKLAEEGGEEIRSDLIALLNTTRDAQVSNFILGSFLTLRKLKLFGLAPVTEAKEPWTIAEKIEEKVEQIPDAALRIFVENFLERVEESIIEMGYVVAFTLDDFFAAQRFAETTQTVRTVTLQPDRNTPEETVLIEGGQEEVIQTVQNTLATHTLVQNRDVGMILGQEITEHVRHSPTTNPSELTLKIMFYGVKEPPWRRNGKIAQRAQVSIPNVKRTKLDWQTIKTVCGGTNGYLWGRFKAIGILINDGGSIADKLIVYGGSAEEAEDRLLALAQLSEYTVANILCTEERNYGRRTSARPTYKQTTRVYPAYFTVINAQRILNEAAGRTEISGTYTRQKAKILLYPANKPDDFDEVVNEILRTPGADI